MKRLELTKLRHMKATQKIIRLASEDSPRWNGYPYAKRYLRSFYMRSHIQDGILKVAFFLTEYLRMGSRIPAFELYLDRANQDFLTYDTGAKLWRTAKLDILPWPNYVRLQDAWISKSDNKRIRNYLGGTAGGYRGLLDFQLTIRSDQLQRKYRCETAPWDLDLSQVPPLPRVYLKSQNCTKNKEQWRKATAEVVK